MFVLDEDATTVRLGKSSGDRANGQLVSMAWRALRLARTLVRKRPNLATSCGER
jgi:hypothetical protein